MMNALMDMWLVLLMQRYACSQLQPYGFGDCHWALAHLLAMVGAFFGCLLVASYEFEGLVTSLEGFRIEGVSRHTSPPLLCSRSAHLTVQK